MPVQTQHPLNPRGKGGGGGEEAHGWPLVHMELALHPRLLKLEPCNGSDLCPVL